MEVVIMVKFYMKNGAVIEVDIVMGVRAIARNLQKAKDDGEMYFADGETVRVFIDPAEVAAIEAPREK